MKVIPKKKCNKIGCNQLINFNQSYCEEHSYLVNEDRNSYAQSRYAREKPIATFYNSKAWREVRRTAALRDNELCQYCLNQGIVKRYEVVDHFIPIKYDYEKRLDLDNLVASCIRHNTIKERDEKLLRQGKITLPDFKGRWQFGLSRI